MRGALIDWFASRNGERYPPEHLLDIKKLFESD